MPDRIPFNKWSRERIAQGRKTCTSRTKLYYDPRVTKIEIMPLSRVRDERWREEGADSPEEFVKVWKSIHRGRFNPDQLVIVYHGDFREE